MAEERSSKSAENDGVELEAKRKGSCSWHPCQVSLCSRGLGLVVRYEDDDFEEMLDDKQEILTRVRLRSTPLQGDDCSSLKQGDHVLATQNLQVDPVFYDALVEEGVRVRHSKRSHCRCSFRIKWLHQALKEAVTVPARAIMKLATKSINLNPTISTFFSKLESSNGLDTQQHSTFVDGSNWEMDINVLLEKQIEEISNSTDASQEKISKNFIFGLKVDLNGQSHGMSFDASLRDPPDTNNLKFSTGSKHKNPTETMFENPRAFVSSVEEKITGIRSPLSPLAARAALASIRSEFPQNKELSVQRNADKGGVTSAQSANTGDFLLTLSATLGGKSRKHKSDAKVFFPTADAPSPIELNGQKNKGSKTRFSRAQIQSNDGVHESPRKTNKNVTQYNSSTRRVTRSATNRAGKTDVEEYKAEVEEQSKSVESNTSTQISVAPHNCLSDNEKPVASPVDKNEKFRLVAKADSQRATFAEDVTKHNYPRRSTRSVAKGEATPTSTESVSSSSRGVKRKSASSKQETTRFSPRLRSLHQTHSQTKA